MENEGGAGKRKYHVENFFSCYNLGDRKERNKRCFKGVCTREDSLVHRVKFLISYWFSILLEFKDVSMDTMLISCQSHPSWSPPPSGFLKLKFERSEIGDPGESGIQGVIRDDVAPMMIVVRTGLRKLA